VSVSNISPAELMADLLNRLGGDLAPSGAVVGPANDAQQQAGVLQIVDAGMPIIDQYRPVIWVRTQIRCLAGTLDEAERIARRTQLFLFGLENRTVVHQSSTEEDYLIHTLTVSAGPSMHFDTPETWETLLFIETCMGIDPLP
jgi:hypothetical protein